MTIDEILEQLADVQPGQFPEQAVTEAMARREEITPHLFEILKTTRGSCRDLLARESYCAHLFALMLLAYFREQKAYPLIVDLATADAEAIDALLGDLITEDLHRILVSVYDGNLEPIQRLIENESVAEFVRGAGIDTLTTLIVHGLLDRDTALVYFKQLFDGRLPRVASHVWDSLVDTCADLAMGELRDEVSWAYEQGLASPHFITLAEVERLFAVGPEKALARLAREHRFGLVGNVVDELKWWACFKGSERPAPIKDKRWSDEARPLAGRPVPNLPASPKVGRNEPCPCGSGKKYKKCCGAPGKG